MLSIIYPYRERDLDRIRWSLNSLENQNNLSFKVFFVDYGSSLNHAKAVKELVALYPFVNYTYVYAQYQPWNKSRALNGIIKHLDTAYFFVADIDMVFKKNFIHEAIRLTETNQVWYFKVGFMSQKESEKEKSYSSYKINFESNYEATGLTLCPVEYAKKIRGFDEFYHFWGAEDTDFHARLAHAGYVINYYDTSILMLHKWHKNYKSSDVNSLTKALKVDNVVAFNHRHLKTVLLTKKIYANSKGWGVLMTKEEDEVLYNQVKNRNITTKKSEIDYFLYHTLKHLELNKGYQFTFIETEFTFKAVLKSWLKQKKIKTYPLKSVNDLLLKHLLYILLPYNYALKISADFKSIQLNIILK